MLKCNEGITYKDHMHAGVGNSAVTCIPLFSMASTSDCSQPPAPPPAFYILSSYCKKMAIVSKITHPI